ncbi:ADP-ribosyl-[dinitrogen reductase] hydrolase [Acidihalobacter aeolianus]|uniref:ADP-ribosyl-[dinitrogen reductase] hydrolase n=1 Tax=Acidihalobacter aeolianus TaxID=2792603 RepID=A0A1D8K9Y3_9GAMM|nr:ADP-ribosyl-[dinitrogen reductase] hydrolase [Acidihalobacter aeolianus]AOV17770.1 ADP-ribosyl-[dinitrogen reductase] hydrolase [Acidihalobacter aeolianus]
MLAASGPRTDRSALLSRARGAYLGLAVGDALGATLEFMTPREIRATYGVHDRIRGGGWLHLPRGQVTDDTTMSLALGEAMPAQGDTVDAEGAARAFDTWMRGKPVDIGNTVRRGLLHYRSSGNPTVAPDEYAAGNGAAMRCLPVALATLGRPTEAVRSATLAQAWVTHRNELSDVACVCLVEMLQLALPGTATLAVLHTRARALVERHAAFEFRRTRRENPSAYVVETLQAVFQALFEAGGFEASVVDVVNRGGDADTTGAITGMLAGAWYGVEAIPRRWLAVLDREVKRACEQQAEALIGLADARC